MIVLGVDCGLTAANPTALVLLENGVWLLRTDLPSDQEDWLARCRAIWTGVKTYLERFEPDLVGVEGAHFGLNPQVAIKLSFLAGGIARVVAEHDIPLILVQPSQAKKALTGSGRATKEDMQAAATLLYDTPNFPSHQADACGIALAAQEIANGSQKDNRNSHGKRVTKRQPAPANGNGGDPAAAPTRKRATRAGTAQTAAV